MTGGPVVPPGPPAPVDPADVVGPLQAEIERLRAQTARQADMISELGGAALDRGADTPASTALLAAIVTALRDGNAPPRPPGATHADEQPGSACPCTRDVPGPQNAAEGFREVER